MAKRTKAEIAQAIADEKLDKQDERRINNHIAKIAAITGNNKRVKVSPVVSSTLVALSALPVAPAVKRKPIQAIKRQSDLVIGTPAKPYVKPAVASDKANRPLAKPSRILVDMAAAKRQKPSHEQRKDAITSHLAKHEIRLRKALAAGDTLRAAKEAAFIARDQMRYQAVNQAIADRPVKAAVKAMADRTAELVKDSVSASSTRGTRSMGSLQQRHYALELAAAVPVDMPVTVLPAGFALGVKRKA